jgi:hypothetical protein
VGGRGDNTAKAQSAGKGQKEIEKGRIWFVFARFFAFFRRDLLQFFVDYKSVMCTLHQIRGTFFRFSAKMEPWRRIYGKLPL